MRRFRALAGWLAVIALCIGLAPTAAAISHRRPAAAHLTIAENPTVSVGTGRPVYLSLVAKSIKGASVPATRVRWRVIGTSKEAASVKGSGGGAATFTATAPGTYTVEAVAGGFRARGTVLIHGAPAAIVLTPSKLTVPRDANGDAVTVTASVVDANGVRLGDFVGDAVLTDTNGQLCAWGNNNRDVLHFVDGVATDYVCAATAKQGSTDTLTTSDLQEGFPIGPMTPVTGVRYIAASVTNVAPIVNTLSYQVQQGDPPYLSAGSSTSLQLLVTTRDQNGNLWGNPPAAVDVTLTGPGSLSEAGVVKSETLTTPTQGDLITVFSQVGHPGTVTVTASAPGWTGWTYTVQSYLNTKPAGLTISPDGTGTNRDAMPYTLYRIDLVDTKGQPEALASDQLTVTDNAARQPTRNVLADVFGGPHASLLFGQDLPGDMAAIEVGPPGQPPPRLYMQDGQAILVVETGAAGDAPVTIQVTDALHHFTASTAYDWQVGPVGGVSAHPNATFATALTPGGGQRCMSLPDKSFPCLYSVLAGERVPFSVQLTDANGNPLALADVPVLFGAGGTDPGNLPGGKPYVTAWTGPLGQVSTLVTAPKPLPPREGQPGPQGVFAVQAWQESGITGMSLQSNCGCGPQTAVVDAADYATAVQLAGAQRRTVRVGQGLTLAASVLNAKGAPIQESVAGSSDFNDDVLSIRSSNPRIVALFDRRTDRNVGFLYVPSTLHGAAPLTWGLPALRALRPGTATITVRDVSNPTRPTAKIVIKVVRR